MTVDDAEPQPRNHSKYRRTMKWRVVLVILAVALIYFFLLFPEEAASQLVGSAHQVGRILTSLGGAAVLTVLLPFVLFASDSAFNGKSKTAKWVRERFPAHAAKEAYDCSDVEASALWFEYFDTWESAKSSHRNFMQTSYEATYTARLVFYLRRTLYIFFALGVLTVVGHATVLDTYMGEAGQTTLIVHGLVLMAFLLSAAIASYQNRVGDPPTGCWYRLQDVFGRSRVFFEDEVIKRADSIEEARAVVEEIRKRLA